MNFQNMQDSAMDSSKTVNAALENKKLQRFTVICSEVCNTLFEVF